MLHRWYKPSVSKSQCSEIELGHHQWGEFSMAAVKSDPVVQGYSQLESGSMSLHPSGPYGAFVGIYDGHGGPNASEFIKDHLFEIVKRLMSDRGEMSGGVLDLSFLALDEQYLQLVRNESEAFPSLLSAGSSCLVGVVIEGRVYIANVGDSRAVLARRHRPKQPVQLVREQLTRLKLNVQRAGQKLLMPNLDEQLAFRYLDFPWQLEQPPRPPYLETKPLVQSFLNRNPYRRPGRNRHIEAIQLSTDHSASLPSVEQELKELHPRDHRIVTFNDYGDEICRVKGILPTSRSIGDVYLKSWEFNTRPELPREYKVRVQFNKPIILHDPALFDQELLPEDKFIIFASPGLWSYVANEEAVDMVINSSQKGIAMKLLKKALKRRAWFTELKNLNTRKRICICDDISVVVLFLDRKLIRGGRCKHLSLKSYEASTSQLHTGEASTSQSRTAGASTSQPHSTSQTRTTGASFSKSKSWPGFSRRDET
ncbi:protein-serine/threonine phosphatase [Salvia divinorum]|uniref:protein-serine/threonine phosphatase n=1 Tax=Salvia divinorum TaxID=28513 RepID=A0ABD1GEK7_SALDI